MLAHNITHVRRFERLGRVDVVQGDCLEKLPTLDVDWSSTLVFADPPWGGRHYEDCQDVDSEQGVHLKGSGTLDGFVETVAGLGCRHLLLKVPHTFDAARFSVNTAVARCDARAVADKVQLSRSSRSSGPHRLPAQEASRRSRRRRRRVYLPCVACARSAEDAGSTCPSNVRPPPPACFCAARTWRMLTSDS